VRVYSSQGSSARASPFAPDRLEGSVQFVLSLLDAWNLPRSSAAVLLGLEDEASAEALLTGRASLRGVDAKARVAALFRIRSLLDSLYRDIDVERRWLHTPARALGNRSPMGLLNEGSMESLLTIRQYVEHISGL
jgi:hypothetical protein